MTTQSGLRLVSVGLWLGYLLIPVEGWGIFSGRPLGFLPLAALAIAGWLTVVRGSPGATPVVAVALALKLGFGTTVIIQRGFESRYFANAAFAEPFERSTEPAGPTFTRVDDQLAFGGEHKKDLPLEFLNDLRFNFYQPAQPDRRGLPFSVRWQGVWYVPVTAPQRLYLRAPGGVAQINIGDTFQAQVDHGNWTGAMDLPSGFHRLSVSLAVQQGGDRQFEAGRIVDSREIPFDGSTVLRHRAGGFARAIDGLVRGSSWILDLMLGSWLLLIVFSDLRAALRRLRVAPHARDALVVLTFVAIADALVFAAPVAGRMITLSGGNDWLLYEAQARDIGLNGLWMTMGDRLGQGHPFYGQPLYPYFLAACHWLFGAGLFGIYFVQRLMAAATVLVLWRTTVVLTNEAAGAAALMTAFVVVYEKVAPWSGFLLTEMLFVPLVCTWLYCLVRLASGHGAIGRQAFVAGVVGGLATLTRANLLIAWVLVLPALAVAMGPTRRRWTAIAVIASAMIGVCSMAMVRNWVVARAIVPISSEGSVVLFLGNPPPPLEVPPAHAAQYERLGLGVHARAVAEYVRQRPAAFLAGLWRKSQYTLGWFEPLVPGAGRSLFYMTVWLTALGGVTMWRRLFGMRSLAIAALPLLVAISHFATNVIFLPNVYGDRMLLMFYVLMVPYAAVALMLLWRTISRAGMFTAGRVVWCAALMACAIEAYLPGWIGVDLMLYPALLLAASLACGEPWKSGRGLGIFAAVAVSLTVTFALAPSEGAAIEYRRQLAWLALAPAVIPLAAVTSTRRFATAGLMAILAVGLVLATYAQATDVWRVPLSSVAVTGDRSLFWGVILGVVLLWTARHLITSRSEWTAIAVVAGTVLSIGSLLWLGAGVGTLNNAAGILAWQAAGRDLMTGHWWFGLGLSASPLLPPLHQSASTGGLSLGLLISVGIAGSVSYVALWARQLWTSRQPREWSRAALHGVLLGTWAYAQSQNLLIGPSAQTAVLTFVGLAFGLIESGTHASISGTDPSAV